MISNLYYNIFFDPYIHFLIHAFVDSGAGTISLGIPNTERGHCGKTLAILRYAASQYKMNATFKWLIIADDDTILRYSNLQHICIC